MRKDAHRHVDAVWPRLIKLGQWPVRIKIRDGQAHLVGHLHQDTVLPLAESLSFVVGVLGWTVGIEQSLTYTTATPCQIESPAP